ncbi:MAG: permease [Bdellovibrio sp. CG10_big_fil_rev_8_21_14_0_10_47_8]|nr:MAG: permease [Bdellovibrio sp. CG10_big_fil_rev_8_21_14_0_10_47_8]
MLFLAFRHLISRKKQTFFILLGVTLGTMVYIFVSGMQLGLREFIIEQLVENDAHLKVSGREEWIEPPAMAEALFGPNKVVSWFVPPAGKRDEERILYPQGWIERLRRTPDVAAYSEQMVIQVIAAKGAVKSNATLVGVVPDRQRQVTIIEKYITDGRYTDIGQSGNRVVVGDGLLKKMGGRLGDTLLIGGTGSKPTPFKVAAVFHLGVQQFDDNFIYGALRDVQQLNGTPGRITHIAVRLYDVTQAASLANYLSVGAADKVQSWDQANQSFLQLFQIQDLFRIMITVGILVIAAFGIYNVLTIIVNQKRREIAILRSLGYTPREIMSLFLIQGLAIGVVGAFFGLGFGYGACRWLGIWGENFSGHFKLTISYEPSIYVTAFAMATLSSLVAGLIPAVAAGRMTPIDIIRQEG